MSLKHEFNRITHLFDGGLEKAVGKQACGTQIRRRVRERMDTGRRNVMSVEEAVVRHIRENPALYLIGAALLIGVLIARLILDARRVPQAPLL